MSKDRALSLPLTGGRDERSPELGRRPTAYYCPASASYTHDEGSRRDGRCTWCEHRFTGPAPRPRMPDGYLTELDLAYRRAYDPDYGAGRHDV